MSRFERSSALHASAWPIGDPRTVTVLVADDEPDVRQSVGLLLERAGYSVVLAVDGGEALGRMASRRPDIALLDVNMPGCDGFEVCRRIKDDPRTCLTPVVLITALCATSDRVEGINAGADDMLAKPFSTAELLARLRALVRHRKAIDDLEPAETVMLSLAMTIEARDPYTRGHCERLARYATVLGEQLGLDEQTMVTLHRGAFLHDLGKIGIPDAILLKQGPLQPAEYAVMQRHTEIGDQLCSHLQSLADVRRVVRHHHERLDGSGYPDRLQGDDIPLTAQIVGIVDVFDAITTSRPHKAARTPATAIQCLREEVDKGWRDADLVEELARVVALEFGSRASVISAA